MRTIENLQVRLLLSNKTHKKHHKWSLKYKRSINCRRPRGFSQKQYCKYGRKNNKKTKKFKK